MQTRIVRLFNFAGAGLVAITVAACTVHNSQTPGLSGPSGAVGPISLPSQPPTARFSFSPSAPPANSAVSFDGTLSCGGLADPSATTPCVPANYPITSYSWNFGDGRTASGPTTSHSFDTAGSYAVQLTVSNSAGFSHTTSRPVPVAAGLLPTAAFTVSPGSPKVNVSAVFNGSTSTAGIGHTLVGWAWDFGDPNDRAAGSGQVVSHAFTVAGSYVVNLTAIDEAGQTKSASATLTVVP